MLSAESISSTISQRTRASGDAAPNSFDAARAASMAEELSTRSQRAVVWRGMAEGAKADADAARSDVIMSFMVY